MTTKQLNAYLTRNFSGLHGQVSYHGANRYSVQVFGASGLVLDLDVPNAVSLAEIGKWLRTQ
jgi:hypothetical protein